MTLANDWGGLDSWRVTLAGFLPLIVHEMRLTTHTGVDGACWTREAALCPPPGQAEGQRCPTLLPLCSPSPPSPPPDTLPDLFIYSSRPNTRFTIIPGRQHEGDECPPGEGVDRVSAAYYSGTRPGVEQSGAVMTPASAAPRHTRTSGRNAS